MIEALTESPTGCKCLLPDGAKRRRTDWEHTIREGPRCGRRDEDAAGPIGSSCSCPNVRNQSRSKESRMKSAAFTKLSSKSSLNSREPEYFPSSRSILLRLFLFTCAVRSRISEGAGAICRFRRRTFQLRRGGGVVAEGRNQRGICVRWRPSWVENWGHGIVGRNIC